MCGIVGIAGVMPVNQSIYDALTVLQHRGRSEERRVGKECFSL